MKYPISALVASYNEGHLLEDCLKSIQFCDEIYFVNLGSTDNSVEIAKKYATTVEEFKKVPRIEDVHPLFIPKLKYDWFILIDPDERIMPELAKDVINFVQNPEPFVSLVRAPILYLFKGKKLKGGPYKEVIIGRLLFYRPGLMISDEVHSGIKAKAGYWKTNIKFTGENYNEHFWCNSWKQLKDKHNRYTQGEGRVLYIEGKRYSVLKQITQTIKRFFTALFGEQYYKDGFTGLGFSYHEARYTFLSWSSLRKYQKLMKKEGTFKTPIEVQKDLIKQRVADFEKVSLDLAKDYENTVDEKKEDMLIQYKKSTHRLINDALEIGCFEEVRKVQDAVSFSHIMKDYIANEVFIERFKLIENSGSYKLAKRIGKLLK